MIQRGEKHWLFYSLLLVRNLKHSPICLLLFLTHTMTSAPIKVAAVSQFRASLRLSGVWNPRLHTPMTANVKTVPTVTTVWPRRLGCESWSLGNNRWHLERSQGRSQGPTGIWRRNKQIFLLNFYDTSMFSSNLLECLITQDPLHHNTSLKELSVQVWVLITAGSVGESFLKHDTHGNQWHPDTVLVTWFMFKIMFTSM